MSRKKMLNKRTVIIASSLAAITLTAFLVATADRRRRSKSLEPNRFLSHTNSKVNVVITTNTTTSTTASRQQHNEEAQSLSPLLQGSNTIEATPTATTISTNIPNGEREEDTTTSTSPLSVAVLYHPREPSTTENNTMKISSSQTSKEEELSVSDDTKKARESLRELIVAAIKDAKDSAKGTGKQLKEQAGRIADTIDKKDIQSSRNNLNTLLGLFEETMREIRKEHYDEQVKLLDSYKDLLQTQIKVVNARGRMAGKLKPGA